MLKPSLNQGLSDGMIIGFGNSLLDLIASVDEEILKQYNLTANNNYLAQDNHRILFKELIEKYNAKYVVGGSAQNTLRVAQWVLERPKVCVMMGAIGRDNQGKLLADTAEADGVDTRYQYIDKPTGVCGVLVTNNGRDRTLLADLSAALCFSVDHLLKEENEKLLNQANVIYVTGFFMSVCVESITHLAKVAYKHKKWFIMNLSASFLAERYIAEWRSILPYVDILFGNDIEARAYAKAFGFEESFDIESIALCLSKQPKNRQNQPRTVIITQGNKPVVVAKGGEIKTYPVIRLKDEEVVDTIGAGDAFVGGFLAQLVRGLDLDQCMKCALWCASQMVQQEGCSIQGFIKYSP